MHQKAWLTEGWMVENGWSDECPRNNMPLQLFEVGGIMTNRADPGSAGPGLTVVCSRLKIKTVQNDSSWLLNKSTKANQWSVSFFSPGNRKKHEWRKADEDSTNLSGNTDDSRRFIAFSIHFENQQTTNLLHLPYLVYNLTLSTLGKIFSRWHFEIFSYFSQKTWWHFMQRKQFVWNVTSCFLGKIRKIS